MFLLTTAGVSRVHVVDAKTGASVFTRDQPAKLVVWGPDDRTLVDQFHIPAGRPVALTLESEDVIHSFFLPSLRIKQDVLPGRRLDAWIDAMTPGRYELPCAYLCGMGHTGMAAWLEVHAPEAWRQWVAAQWPEAGR